MDMGIDGKYALVTGGSRGIGRAIALGLAGEGCNVAICARENKDIMKTVKEIEKRGVDAIGVSANVMYPQAIRRVIDTVIDNWNRVDILVNNVGGGGRWGDMVFEDTDEQVWLDVYNKNVMVAVRFTMGLVPVMVKNHWGRVIVISSIYGREGGGRPWFNMAKGAEICLMKSLSKHREYTKQGVTFNSVAPGYIKTSNPKSCVDVENVNNPLCRVGLPDEVADVVVFLCSSRCGFVNGCCMVVDGGRSNSF